MAVFFTIVVGALACLLALAAWLRPGHGGVPVWVIVSASLLTASVLGLSVVNAQTGGRLGGLRLTLESVSFPVGARRVLSIGGDPAQDYIVARGLPSRAVSLEVLPDRIIARVSQLSGAVVKVGYGGPFREKLAENTTSTLKFDRPIILTMSRVGCGERQRAFSRKHQSCELVLSRPAPGQIRIGFVEPEAMAFTAGRLDQVFKALAREGQRSLTLTLEGGETPAIAGAAVSGLNFWSLGKATESSIPGRILVSRTGDSFAVESATQAARLPYGSSFAIGGKAQALMRVDRQDMNWRVYDLAKWLPYVALAVSLIGTWGARRRSPIAFSLLSLVDFLLMMRLLVSMDAAYTSTRVDMVYAVRDALEALCAAPFLLALFALPPSRRETWTSCAQGLFGLAGVCLVGIHWGGLGSVGWLFAGACLLGALVAVFEVDALARCASWVRRRWMGVHGLLERVPPRFRVWTEAWWGSTWFPLSMLCLLGAIRLGLVFAHVRDRLLPFGPRIAVTILYVPPFVALAAWAFHRVVSAVSREGVRSTYALLLIVAWWASLVVALLWVIPDHDVGFVFVNIWAFLLLGAIAAIDILRRRFLAASLLGGPWIAAILGVLLLHSLGHFGPRSDEVAAAARTQDPAQMTALLGSYADDTNGWMRLQQLAVPDGLAQVGTREAEGLQDTFAHMAVYADTRFGRGFIPTEAPTDLFDPQLRDNVASVHIISPFGVAGAAAFMAVLLAGTLGPSGLALARRRWSLANMPTSELIGVLALWVFAVSGIYMILANLQITPFTGRNIYLLAADSVGDLIEGLTLMVMAVRLLDREVVA